MPSTLELLQTLISKPSITPLDSGCQPMIADYLKKLNFEIEYLRFGEVDNLWARYGDAEPLLVFAGHTDVVPPGPLEQWKSQPFEPTVRDGKLYGRGACDMKSGLAAMLTATKNFLAAHADFTGSIAFLITSDEEGPSTEGTAKVIEELIRRKTKMDYCIIGEASGEKQLGDQIRVGRRGSLHGKLTLIGKQGHIAYPDRAINPIHQSFAALNELANEKWDAGNAYFPPTSFQIHTIFSGTGASNVIPGVLETAFNFRFSTAITVADIQQRVYAILNKHGLAFNLTWNLSGEPFLTPQGKLVQSAQKAIREKCGIETLLSTSGGTSDGRFIAKTGAEIIELGPTNTSAHQVDEYVEIAELDKLADIYLAITENLFKGESADREVPSVDLP